MGNMNSKLLNEIVRQQELMGIKEILSEGEGLNFFKQMLHLVDLEPNLKNVFDEVFDDIRISDSDLVDDFEKNFNVTDFKLSSFTDLKKYTSISNTVLNNLLDKLEQKVTSKILQKNDLEFIKLADKIIEYSLDNKPKSRQIYDHLLNLAENSEYKEFEDGVKQYGHLLPHDIIEHLSVKAKNRVKPIDDNSLKILWNSIEEKFGKAWASRVQAWDKIKTWSEYLKELIGKNSVLEGVFTSQPISPIAKLMGISYDKIMPKPSEIKLQLEEVFDEIVMKFERGYDTDIQNEQDRLTAIFSKFLSKRNENHKVLYNTWMSEWMKDLRLKRLFTKDDDFYFKETFNDPKFIEMMEKFETSTGRNISEIKQTYSKFYGSLQFVKSTVGVFKLFNTNRAAWMRYGLNMVDFFQRLFGTVVSWTPNTINELRHNKRVLGTKRWLGLGIGQKIVMSTVWVPLLLSTYRTIGSALQDYVNSKRQANAKPGQKLELVQWWLLDDDEWSTLMRQDKNKGGLNSFLKALSFFGTSFKKTNGANIKELATSPAAWSLAAWAYLENPNFDFSPKELKQQMDSVETNSKVVLDDLQNTGAKDKEVKVVIDSLQISNYDTLSTKINDSLKNRPQIKMEDVNF